MTTPMPVTFVGCDDGPWQVERIEILAGPPLAKVACVRKLNGHVSAPGVWVLRGTTGHQRYTRRAEQAALESVQAGLGRREATRASLIPIRKTEEWWGLAQDERRAIFEESSHHIAACMAYLPAIARRLYHSRELCEPFDFLTWFEYAPNDAGRFAELLATLRATEEWRYVEREIHIELTLG